MPDKKDLYDNDENMPDWLKTGLDSLPDIEEDLPEWLVEDEKVKTLSTRVSEETFSSFSKLAEKWGVSQSTALRNIIDAYILPETSEKFLATIDRNFNLREMERNFPLTEKERNFPLTEKGRKSYVLGTQKYLMKVDWNMKILVWLRGELIRKLVDVDQRIRQIAEAVDVLHNYISQSPANNKEGGEDRQPDKT